MNPTATLRFRRYTGLLAAGYALLAIGLSLFALILPRSGPSLPLDWVFVGGSAVVQDASPEAIAGGVEPGDKVLSIDRTAVMRLYREWDGSHFLKAGVPNVYEIENREGRVRWLTLYPAEPHAFHEPAEVLFHLALLIVSTLYLLIGIIVWWNRQGTAEGWAMLLFCSMVSMQLSTAIRFDLIPWSTTRLVANLPLLGATTFHLFTTYPVEPAWIVRHRRIRAIPYVVAFALSLLVLLEARLGLPARWAPSAAFLYGVVLTMASIGILGSERWRARESGVGDRADLMLLAAIISFSPALVLVLLEYATQSPYPVHLSLLWMGFFPLAVGFGMVRRQLFDFRIMARSSAAYAAATLSITALFALIITFADQVFADFGIEVRSVQVAFLFLAILAFNPLRDRLQRFVDQFFDRDRAHYRAAMREISEAMVSMLSLREIGDRLLVAITDTMGASRAMVLMFDDGDKVLRALAWRGDWDDEDIEIEMGSEHPVLKHLWMRREELSRADLGDEPDPEKREACWDVFDTLEVELLVPILYGVDLQGVIAVGRKIAGDRLGADDRQLMRTLANYSSVAIENAKAFDEIAKLNETLEARVEERTLQLRSTQLQLMQSEKLKSLGQLVAGVAHELNNPIGFVHANLQLLDEFIAKLSEAERTGGDTERARDAIDRLLFRAKEGTERVKQIVQDLQTFSRTDQADVQEVDIHEEIDRTLALMEPRIKGGIAVVREYGDLPRIRCFPGQLNQVFLNLLMNACDVIAPEGTITVRTETTPTGVRLVFHDDGPGIPPSVQGRIFDPFFTTKPVGKGTGLGLSLSHGIIERHGGRIVVSSETGKGTTFVIDLPLDVPPLEE